MKKLDIDLEDINDLLSILKASISKLTYKHREEMIKDMKRADKAITVHLYPVWYGKSKESLLSMNEWSYHQIYLCLYNNAICYSLGHGGSSGMRENHNFFIDSFLRNKKLRDKTITAIIISHRKDVLAYYFYDKYGYCNQDIGSNWDRKIIERLKKTILPYSYVTHDGFEKRRVIFKTRNKEIEIYKAIKEDIRNRKFLMRIRKKC